MKIKLFLLLTSFVSLSAFAESNTVQEIGIRYGNITNSSGLFDWVPSGQKITQLKYDLTPWANSKDVKQNFYLELAAGEYFPGDFLTGGQSFVGEISPGAQVKAGPILVRLSQGIANTPGMAGLPTLEFVTHFSVGIIDNASGLSISVERTHYSPGNGDGLDFTGFAIGTRF